MKIKKYPQSNLTITLGNTSVCIDPGFLTFEGHFPVDEFNNCQAFLITHSHKDHVDRDKIKAITNGKPIYGNSDVAKSLKEFGVDVTVIEDRQKFNIGEMEIEAVDLPHCKMQDGTDGPPNTGFVINGVLFHPGDGDVAPEGLTSENVALPVAGPSITLDGALQFAKDLQAKVIIPIHYDFFKTDIAKFAKDAGGANIEVRNLQFGEETEI